MEVPVGGGVGKIVHLRKIPVNVYAQFLYNAERPSFVTNWSARFQIQFSFPGEERRTLSYEKTR